MFERPSVSGARIQLNESLLVVVLRHALIADRRLRLHEWMIGRAAVLGVERDHHRIRSSFAKRLELFIEECEDEAGAGWIVRTPLEENGPYARYMFRKAAALDDFPPHAV